jgi:hypothetical protein
MTTVIGYDEDCGKKEKKEKERKKERKKERNHKMDRERLRRQVQCDIKKNQEHDATDMTSLTALLNRPSPFHSS